MLRQSIEKALTLRNSNPWAIPLPSNEGVTVFALSRDLWEDTCSKACCKRQQTGHHARRDA